MSDSGRPFQRAEFLNRRFSFDGARQRTTADRWGSAREPSMPCARHWHCSSAGSSGRENASRRTGLVDVCPRPAWPPNGRIGVQVAGSQGTAGHRPSIATSRTDAPGGDQRADGRIRPRHGPPPGHVPARAQGRSQAPGDHAGGRGLPVRFAPATGGRRGRRQRLSEQRDDVVRRPVSSPGGTGEPPREVRRPRRGTGPCAGAGGVDAFRRVSGNTARRPTGCPPGELRGGSGRGGRRSEDAVSRWRVQRGYSISTRR